jgi:hypothetical protein
MAVVCAEMDSGLFATFATRHGIPRRRDPRFDHVRDVRAVLLALRVVGHAPIPRGRHGGVKVRAAGLPFGAFPPKERLGRALARVPARHASFPPLRANAASEPSVAFLEGCCYLS